MADPLKYAKVERERRFVIAAVPDGVVATHEIADRYLVGTRLRLREQRTDGVVTRKLGQKIRLTDGPAEIAHTTLYLDDAEWAVLAALPAQVLTKKRHIVERDGVMVAIDEHENGRLVAEIDDVSVPLPDWLEVVSDVSDDEAFTGAALARPDLERWTAGTVYADMWVNPDDDPRNTDGVSPDGELATLDDYLHSYRLTMLMKCDGLTPAQLATRSAPPSTMSLLGLVRHLAEVERDWRGWVIGEKLPKIYGRRDADFDEAVGSQEMVDAAFTDLAREQAETDALLASHEDLGERVGKDGIAIREILVHRVEEYARHCGHADLIRERVDGRTGQ